MGNRWTDIKPGDMILRDNVSEAYLVLGVNKSNLDVSDLLTITCLPMWINPRVPVSRRGIELFRPRIDQEMTRWYFIKGQRSK